MTGAPFGEYSVADAILAVAASHRLIHGIPTAQRLTVWLPEAMAALVESPVPDVWLSFYRGTGPIYVRADDGPPTIEGNLIVAEARFDEPEGGG